MTLSFDGWLVGVSKWVDGGRRDWRLARVAPARWKFNTFLNIVLGTDWLVYTGDYKYQELIQF